MPSWKTLTEGAHLSIEELKIELPLQYVVAEAGVVLTPDGDRLSGLCPFHQDSNPSFSVYGEQLERVGCWSCDFGNSGDLLDFIQTWRGIGLNAAVVYGNKMLAKYREGGWAPQEVEQGPPPDKTLWLPHVRDAFTRYDQDDTAVGRLLQYKDLPISPQWAHDEFWLGVRDSDRVVIPHFTKDRQLLGYKTRNGTARAFATKGAQFTSLYGIWRDEGQSQVIVCEGESDVWMTAWVTRKDDVLVVGLPTGTNSPISEQWLADLKGRNVTLLFDSDRAGRSAVRRWSEALAGESVSVAVLPEGYDACSAGQAVLERTIRRSSKVKALQGSVIASSEGYVRASNGDPVSDWLFEPQRYLVFNDGSFGFEGILSDGRHTVITSMDLTSEQTLKRWASTHECHFFGSSKDAQWISKILSNERPFLSAGKGTFLAGWHGDAFVTPAGSLGKGSEDWIYVPSVVEQQMTRIVTLWENEASSSKDLITDMLLLNRRAVVDPIIGWLGAAVMRSALKEFPTLAIVGGSGTGKTTIIDAIMGAFGFGGGEQNLTSTTRYGLSQLVAGSNGVPVWIDEYRPGAARDTLLAMEQIIRDAWRASTSLRGGVGNNWSQIAATSASAPIIVSGEDVFSETSLIERVVMVRIPQDLSQRSPEALARVRRGGQFGRGYIDWLLSVNTGVPDTVGMGREETGITIVNWGWSMLRQYMIATTGWDMGPMTPPEIFEGRARLAPYVELAVWGIDQNDAQMRPLVWKVGDDQWAVRPRELMRVAAQHDWQLPGGERALSDWLLERYGGIKKRTEYGWAVVLKHAAEITQASEAEL